MKDRSLQKDEAIKWTKVMDNEILRLKHDQSWHFYIKPKL